MMCLVFIWLLFRCWEFSLKCLCVFLIFMSTHAVRDPHNLIHLITCCKMGMAHPEGRPIFLVCVPPELITHFLCLRTERKFLSVFLAFWMWKCFLLLAEVFCKPQYSCKPCMLLEQQNNCHSFYENSAVWWKLGLGIHITVLGSGVLLCLVFHACCSLDKSVTSQIHCLTNCLEVQYPKGKVQRRNLGRVCSKHTYFFI